jgi:hypothetical protein
MEVNGKGIAVREVLARSFRVICPDLEGSGCSPLEGELSIDGFVADMAHCWAH